MLLAHNADVNAKNNIGYTPLYIAVVGNHKDVAELLLAHNADVNAKDNNGFTMVNTEVIFNHKDMVELLLAHNADVNAKGHKGSTPLQYEKTMIRFGPKEHKEEYKAIAELLRQHGGH